MKHMYVSYCPTTAAGNKATSEELNGYFKKMKESGKEHGFDVVFWGNPWGVLESLAFVVTSEKSLDKYVEWRSAWSQKVAKEKLPVYFEASNTTIITEF